MQKIFKLNENDKLVVGINTNKKVNIQLGGEEINFFLGNPAFNDAEMEYMFNFLQHELAYSMAQMIHSDIGAIVGYNNQPALVNSDLFGEPLTRATPKRQYSKRKYKLKLFYVRIFDKQGQCVFERTNNFRTKMEAKKYAYDVIANTSNNSGMMKSRVKIYKI